MADEVVFKVGDEVEWTSAANGSWKTKRGTIKSIAMGDPFWGSKKRVQNCKVVVPPKEGSKAKAQIYFPRTSKLVKIEAK